MNLSKATNEQWVGVQIQFILVKKPEPSQGFASCCRMLPSSSKSSLKCWFPPPPPSDKASGHRCQGSLQTFPLTQETPQVCLTPDEILLALAWML